MRPLILIICHFILISLLFTGYRLINNKQVLPENEVLQSAHDTYHYQTIKAEGYSWHEREQSNVAFFPAFPYLWRWSGLNALGISFVNLLVFGLGMWLLANTYHFQWKELLLALSIPAMFFMYVPYSEAFFFLPSVLLLSGLKRRKAYPGASGFFLAGLVRSAGNVFLPALLLLPVLTRRLRMFTLLLYVFTTLAAVAIVAAIQHYQTGEWFGFISTQQHWGHALGFPHLPFTSWSTEKWLDAFALLAGLMCGILVVVQLIMGLKGKKSRRQDLFFSLLYLGGLTAFAIISKGGDLFSLNRYLLPTAFFLVVLFYFLRMGRRVNWEQIAYLFFTVFIFFISMHFFSHIKIVSTYFLLGLYVCLYFMLKHKHNLIRQYAFLLLYAINVLLQVYLLDEFLSGNFIA